MECAGTPILEVTATSNVWDIAGGYEPVNLFSGGPAYNLNKNIRYTQEKFRGYYLAFLPSETYTEGPDYLGGINVFDSNYETDDDYDDQLYMNSAVQLAQFMGYTDFSENVMSDEEDTYGACYAMTRTKNPYRAIQHIGAVLYESKEDEGNDALVSIAANITYNGYSYAAVNKLRKPLKPSTIYYGPDDKYFEISTYEAFEIDEYPRGHLYVTGCIPGLQPLEITDIQFTTNSNISGLVSDFYAKETSKPVDIGKYLEGHDAIYMKRKVKQDCYAPGYKSMYLYYNNKNNVNADGIYINSLYLYDKTEISMAYEKQGTEIDNEDISIFQVKQQLAQMGATKLYSRNINPQEFDSGNFLYSSYPDSDNMTLIGMSFTDNQNKALTDIKLVRFSGYTQPPRKYQINGITYTLCSDINVYRRDPSEEGIYDCVYLYATTNPAAGDKITDVVVDGNPILSGYETVKSYYRSTYTGILNPDGSYGPMHTREVSSERVLYLCEDGTYLHLTRENSGRNPYIGEVYAEETDDNPELALCRLADKGCTEFIDRDLNEGAGGDYIYLGYTKTDDANKAVRDIYLFNTDDSKYSPPMQRQFYGRNYYAVANGLDFNKNAGGTYIYMYQSKDKNAGKPLTALSVGETVPIEDVNIGQYPVKCYDTVYADKPLDLNNKAGGKYLYLTMYKSITNEVTYDENGIGIIQGGGLVSGGFKPYYAQDWLCSSVIGEGSVVMIIICSGVLLGAGALILILRRRRNMKNK